LAESRGVGSTTLFFCADRKPPGMLKLAG